MRILLIGHGKMGKAIEQAALKKGHTLSGIVSAGSAAQLSGFGPHNTDVAIEFTRPEAAVQNIRYCLSSGLPVVSGTTGWNQHLPEVEDLCRARNGALFVASNFSIGVNLFFRLNKFLAGLVKDFQQYNVSLDETHLTQKLDRPSGTAITLAEQILRAHTAKVRWVNDPSADLRDLVISSYREEHVVGTHVVHYDSEIDSIEIKHTAHSREGFVEGALQAAEWLVGRHGVFGMDDLLGFGSSAPAE